MDDQCKKPRHWRFAWQDDLRRKLLVGLRRAYPASLVVLVESEHIGSSSCGVC